jgi:hypothetical protein
MTRCRRHRATAEDDEAPAGGFDCGRTIGGGCVDDELATFLNGNALAVTEHDDNAAARRL